MASIGEKIRRLRKEKNLTQSELAGTKITRNMLSQIESGSASPSVSTILYLAQRLEMPAGYFLSSDEDEAFYIKHQVFDRLKKHFCDKQYAACLRIAGQIEQPDDELYLMLSTCCFHLGKDEYRKGRLKKARELMMQCQSYAAQSMYPFFYEESASHYMSAIDRCMNEELTDFPFVLTDCISDSRSAAVMHCLYTMAINGSLSLPDASENIGDTLSPMLVTMLQIAVADKDKRNADCLTLLGHLLKLKPDAVNQYRAFRMGERCAAEAGNYETAYHYARQREKLEKVMQK